MAKNVVNLKSDDNDNGHNDGGEQQTVKTISERDFNLLVKKVKSAQAGMDSERASIGQLVSDATQHKHLHKGAFGIFRRLERMEPYKRAELMFHLDVYIVRAKFDETDLFERAADEAAE